MVRSSAYALSTVSGKTLLLLGPRSNAADNGSSRRWWSMTSMNRLKRRGDNGQPCFTHLVMLMNVLLAVSKVVMILKL